MVTPSNSLLLTAALLLGALRPLSAQTPTSWMPGNGNWFDAAKWSAGVPNSANADVYVDNQPGTNSVVNLNNSVTFGRLRIDAGDRVDTGSTGTLSVNVPNSGFAGAGELLLNGTFAMPSNFTNGAGHSLQGDAITINGTGSLVLGSATGRVYVGTQITNNATIEGAAAFGSVNSSRYKTVNNGTINANVSGALLTLQSLPGANRSVNTGTMRATSGGKLAIGQGEWLNNGTIEAIGANSLVAFYRGDGFLEGGVVTATGGGRIQIGGSFDNWSGGHRFKNVTNNAAAPAGTFELIDTLRVEGTFTNNGTVIVRSPARLETEALPAVTTLNGGGTTFLEWGDYDSPTLGTYPTGKLLIQDQTIRGQGLIGYYRSQSSGAMEITNQGTIQADRTSNGNPLTLRVEAGSFDNRSGGELRAIDGGRLTLSIRDTLQNTGGMIEALNGGIVEAGEGVRVGGGLIRNIGGSIRLNKWTIYNPTGPGSVPAVPLDPNGMILEGQLTLGATGADQTATLAGEIKNSGTLHIASSGTNYSHFALGEAAKDRPHVKLTGGGSVVLGILPDGTIGNGNARFFENLDVAPNNTWQFTREFHNYNNTIRGFGLLGRNPGDYGNFMRLTNEGTIAAEVATKTLRVQLQSGVNNGTFRASNTGTMELTGGSFQQGMNGVLKAENTSPFKFTGSSPSSTTVTGGLVHNDGADPTARNFDLANATFVNLTLRGPFFVRNTGQTGMVGTIHNEGSVHLLNSGSTRTKILVGSSAINNLTLQGPPANPGAGEIILGDPALGGSEASVEAGPNTTPSSLLLTLNQNLHGFGRVGYGSSTDRGMNLINNADIAADVAGKELRVVAFNLTNSPGKALRAINGGNLYLHPQQLINTDAVVQATSNSTVYVNSETTLTGGAVKSESGSVVTLNGGTVAGASVHSDLTSTIAFPIGSTARGGTAITNAGTLLVGSAGNGGTLEGLANGGSTTINAGTIRKVSGGDYSYKSPLNSTGAIEVQQGILRLFGGGELTASRFTAAANSDGGFHGPQPYTFTGLHTFDGPGWHFADSGALVLANNAEIDSTNFNFAGSSVISGTGLFKVSGRLDFRSYANSTTFSGPSLITGAGSVTNVDSSAQFQNNSQWQNSGVVTTNTDSPISGTAGTKFINTEAGELRADNGNQGNLDMEYENRGIFAARNRRLHVRRPGVFKSGTVKTGNGWPVYFQQVPISFEGTNIVTGAAAAMESFGVQMTFAAGAKLNVDAAGFGIHDGSTISGGEINIAKDWGFHNYSGTPMVFTGTQINTAATATGRIRQFTGTTRFQDNARFTNAGVFDIQQIPTVEFNSGSVLDNRGTINIAGDHPSLTFNTAGFFENRGTLNISGNNSTLGTDRPGWTGAGSEALKTFLNSKVTFQRTRTASWPFDIAGEISTEGAVQGTFDKGGVFNQTAKINPVNGSPPAEIRFVGSANTYTVRGQGNQLAGAGYVTFLGTKLAFEDPDPSNPDDNPLLEGTARVALHGTNTVEGNGNLRTSGGFAFEGSLSVDKATLRTLEGSTSTWNAANGNLTLTNEGVIFNDGTLTVVAPVGTWTGTPGTKIANLDNGRFVHDVNATTNINVDFANHGILEFRKGTVNFLKDFRGRGGIAASGGAQVSLSLVGVPQDELPLRFETMALNGLLPRINLTLASGQSLNAAVALNGGTMVAAGGLNMVAAGGLNLVAAGGGNMVAAGGMNLVAAGGGNITAQGPNSLIHGQGGNLIGTDGASLIGTDGASLIGTDGASLIGTDGSSLIGTDGSSLKAQGGAGLIGTDGSSLIGTDGSSLIGTDGASLIGTDGSSLIGTDGSSLVAAGGGNARVGGLAPGIATRYSRAGRGTNAAGIPSDATSLPRRSLDELTGKTGLDAKIARIKELNTQSGASMLYVDATSNVTVQGGGSIIAQNAGVIMGSGTFNGPGLIESGGQLRPGSSAGVMTWNGNLNVQTGGLLEVEIGGTTAGTQHDVLNVSGTMTVSGSLAVRFLNGFGGAVQPAQTFDVVTANGGLATTLAGTRVSVFGTNGSFEIQLVNSGKTLRLTNYQTSGPITFSSWANSYGLTGANAAMTADPNNNGLANLLEYALGLDPTAIGGSLGTSTGTAVDNGLEYLTLSYTRPTGNEARTDITYAPERASSLALNNWSSSVTDVVPFGVTPGPGSLETVTVRSAHPLSTNNRDFLRLKVTLNP